MFANMTAEAPASPSKSPKPVLDKVVPLDSPIRRVAIHPDLPEIKVPDGNLPYHYHPVSCEPFSSEDLQDKLPQLRKQYPTPAAALKAQKEAIEEVKDMLDETEKKRREINQLMEEMEKTRGIERKIFLKQGKNLPDAV